MNPTHERIKFLLRLRGSSLANVAQKLAVSRSVITRVSKGVDKSARIRQAIADELGEKVETLWAGENPK